MKKNYILAVALLASTLLAGAQTIDSLSRVESQWGKALVSSGTNTTTIGGSLVKGDGGTLYMLADAGTKSSSDVITYGDTQIGTGTQNTSTSYNHDFVLSKLNATDGSVLWTVKSTVGEIASGEEWGAKTSDGGVIAAFKVRHTYGRLNDDLAFVDAKGDTTRLNWTLGADATARYYRLLVMKVTADGEISWIKQIDVNHDPQPNASESNKDNTGTGAYLYGLVVDNQDNIYLSGRVCTTMYFTRANGDTVKIVAHNVEGWTGDAQKSVGSLYLVKLDANGNYVNSLVSGGSATCENLRQLIINNGKIYACGVISGLANSTITLGDKSATTTGTYSSWALAKVSLDLGTVDYFKVYESTLSGSAINIPNMYVNDNYVYLMGQAKNTVTAGETTISTTKTRNAMLLKVNAATGELEGGIADATNQSGFFSPFEDANQNLYVGYFSLLGPLKIRKYDQATLTLQDEVQLFPNTSTVQNMVTDGSNLYAMTRFKGSNLSSKAPAKAPFVVSSTGFACLISAYTLPFKSVVTGVNDVNVEKTVKAVRYYNLQGMESAVPHDGLNIKVTTYSDGSREAVKMLK